MVDRQRSNLYPAYIQSADVVGYDIYPIYGWNKPEWMHLGHDATKLFVEMAGRDLYAWIETSKGGQYTGDRHSRRTSPRLTSGRGVDGDLPAQRRSATSRTSGNRPYTQFGVPEEVCRPAGDQQSDHAVGTCNGEFGPVCDCETATAA